MEKPVEHFWQQRLQDLKAALEANNFEVHLAADSAQAAELVLEKLLPESGARSVSWGGSVTFVGSGLYAKLKDRTDLEVIDASEKTFRTRKRSNGAAGPFWWIFSSPAPTP